MNRGGDEESRTPDLFIAKAAPWNGATARKRYGSDDIWLRVLSQCFAQLRRNPLRHVADDTFQVQTDLDRSTLAEPFPARSSTCTSTRCMQLAPGTLAAPSIIQWSASSSQHNCSASKLSGAAQVNGSCTWHTRQAIGPGSTSGDQAASISQHTCSP